MAAQAYESQISSITKNMSKLEEDIKRENQDKSSVLADLASVRELCVKLEASKELVSRQLASKRRLLRSEYPGYRLIVYDAARPMSVQKIMWDKVKGTSKNIYVSNPAHGGGLHNYGLAVDVGILDADGVPLSMGVPVDYMGKESHIAYEDEMVRIGKLTEEERENRRLLRRIMREAGFRPLPTEWWHFNYCSRAEARSRYKCID